MTDNKSESERRGMLTGGFIVTGFGVLFLLINLDILPDIGEMWPLLPIIVGISLIISSFYKGEKSDQSEKSPD
jgi:hypothetical protein